MLPDRCRRLEGAYLSHHLLPKQLIVEPYFTKQQAAIREQEAALENSAAQITEMKEEHGSDDGAFAELDKVNKANVSARLKEIKGEKEARGAAEALQAWLKLATQEAELKKNLKNAEAELDALSYAKYPTLGESDIKTLVVEDKWIAAISAAVHGEMERINQTLTQRVKELAEHYESTLPALTAEVARLSEKVAAHLMKWDSSHEQENRDYRAGRQHQYPEPGCSGLHLAHRYCALSQYARTFFHH